MAQFLKEEVQRAIAEAAAERFAEVGYRRAAIAEIARRARVATGNLYRYYADKDALFDDVVGDEFAREFRRLLRARVLAARRSRRNREALYALASEELLAFCIANRLRVVVLLARAEGTRLADFGERTVRELTALALAHFRTRDPKLALSAPQRLALDLVYRNYVGSLVEILARFSEEKAIRAAVAATAQYHLAGLEALFASLRSR
ncbi:MAG TPA: TetR family transcriptional regulator [Myxococcota bacterium]|nr:TetR family transcriptional regulator [Myxococcota bacterium]